MSNEKVVSFEEKVNKLSEKDKDNILKEMNEVVQQSEKLQVLADLPSNNGQQYHEPEQGEYVTANVTVTSTGEKYISEISDKIEENDKSFEEILEDFGNTIDNYDFTENVEIEFEDVKKVVEDESSIGKFDISDAAVLQLFDTIKLYKQTGKVGFKDLPDEIKVHVDSFLKTHGVATFSVESNTIRNTIAESLISEYITNIEMEKISNEYQDMIDNIFTEMNDEISPIFKDYNQSREDMLNAMIRDVKDEDKKKLAADILDMIHESYSLNKFKELAKRVKVKKFDMEKPQKLFFNIQHKYENSKYKFYELVWVTNVLHKHLKNHGIIEEDDRVSALKFILAYCKVCQNYKPENPVEHVFMYYTAYNIILLDIYKNEQYEEFAKPFLLNVKAVIDVLK